MRSEIFTEAWRLYRMYSITFAKALSIAWAKYKSDKACDNAELSEIFNQSDAKELKEASIILWKKRMSLLNGLTLRAVFTPNIEAYYGAGHYNAD